jgi:hypothetical protein
MLAALGVPLPHAPLASLSRYVNIDWEHLRLNRDQLREFFWSVRPLEWLPIAGLLGLARRSWPKAGLVTAWLIAFLLVKGTAANSSVEDASFFRLMMPSFPAFVLLLAAIPLLVPKLGQTIAGRFPARPVSPRRLERTIVVVAVLVVLIPLVLLATTRVEVGPRTVKNEAQHTSILVSSALRLAAGPSGSGTKLSWTTSYHGPVGVYYAVLRSRPRFPDPSNPEERTVVDGVSCKPRQSGAAQDCALFMRQIHATKDLSFVDRPPPGRWTYRVALGANWLDDPARGDLLMVSEPMTVRTRGHP